MKNTLIDIAEGASKLILEVYEASDSEISFESKSDDSPVTIADTRSDKYICERLEEETGLPVVSEENLESHDKRLSYEKYWIVDPLDGTKNFISKDGEFTINVALIEEKKAIEGLVYVPAESRYYYAREGMGAILGEGGQERPVSNTRTTDKLIGAVSLFHDTPESDLFCQHYGVVEKKSFGSALKLCKLAEGEIDVYPRFVGTKEWDTAAGHCVAREANCKIIDITTGRELEYSKASICNNFFIASRNDLNFQGRGH